MARVDLKTASYSSTPPGGVTELAVTASREERFAAVAKALADAQPIAIPFAKFSDGRGFSLARLLRSEHEFTGEILATGHTIPDQGLHLFRSGFDTVEVSEPATLPQWQKSLQSYAGAYQTAARNPLALRRAATASMAEPLEREKIASDIAA